jgi:lysophospholipase L1-like esterase
LQIFWRSFTLKGELSQAHHLTQGDSVLKTSRLLWGIIGVTSSLTTLLFIGGFLYASNQILFPQAASSDVNISKPAEQKDKLIEGKDKLNIVALGDSLTAGTGDATGKGYVGQVRDKLEQQIGKPVFVLNNLGIPGYTTKQVLTDLSLKKTKDALADANIILLTIGGNDIFQGGAGIFNGTDLQEFNAKAAEERMGPALANVDAILTQLNQANPNAVIFYVGLYHPFSDLDPKREGDLVVQKWNSSVFAMTNRYPNMVLVPIYDLFERNLIKYLSNDHFHPNQDGYARIADRIVQILK